MKKPIIVEKFADNGEHSHWEIVDEFGKVYWSEDKPKLTGAQIIEKFDNLSQAFNLLAVEVDSLYQAVTSMKKKIYNTDAGEIYDYE